MNITQPGSPWSLYQFNCKNVIFNVYFQMEEGGHKSTVPLAQESHSVALSVSVWRETDQL